MRKTRFYSEPVRACRKAKAAALPSGQGTVVYLDASPSLDAALERVVAHGGKIALPRQALPPGMGFFAHIHDLDGNRVGLHAPQ